MLDGRLNASRLRQFNAAPDGAPLRFNGRIGYPMPNRYAPENDSSRVDRNRILSGQDVRTTVMLRNIPNDMSFYQFFEILAANVPGRFDFSYLRIDFKSGRNVGYAFINFATPMDVLLFVDRVSGRNWAVFGDETKVAQVSYASNQGVDPSVENARNSAVMQNWTWVRPKVWYPDNRARSLTSGNSSPRGTNDSAYTGTERPFERPNNATKLARSLENVRNNGLFGANRQYSMPLDARRPVQTGRRPARVAPAHMFDNGNPNAPQDAINFDQPEGGVLVPLPDGSFMRTPHFPMHRRSSAMDATPQTHELTHAALVEQLERRLRELRGMEDEASLAFDAPRPFQNHGPQGRARRYRASYDDLDEQEYQGDLFEGLGGFE